jgi:hypothetical protein
MPSDKTNSHKYAADPDSTFKGAHKLQPNDFDDGSFVTDDSFSYQGDVDIWRVHLNAGETLQANTLNGDDAFPDTVLSVFDHRGRLLAVDDDSGRGFHSFITYTALKSGDYFIAVSQFPSFPTGEGDFAHGGPEFFPPGFLWDPGDYSVRFDILA